MTTTTTFDYMDCLAATAVRTDLALWVFRGTEFNGGRIVGVTRRGVIWIARARGRYDLDEAFASLCRLFDGRQCYVERGLTEGVFETASNGLVCGCDACRDIRYA